MRRRWNRNIFLQPREPAARFGHSLLMSRAGRPRPIAECGAAVTTFCEKRQSRQCWWNAASSPTQLKQRMHKLLLTVKSSQKRSRPESAVVHSVASALELDTSSDWRKHPATIVHRPNQGAQFRSLSDPSARTKKARRLNLRRRRSPRNQLSRKQNATSKEREAD